MYQSPATLNQRVADIVKTFPIKALVTGVASALLLKNIIENQDPSSWDIGVMLTEGAIAWVFHQSHRQPINQLLNDITRRLESLPNTNDAQEERDYLNAAKDSMLFINKFYSGCVLASGALTLTGNFVYNKISSTFFGTGSNDEPSTEHTPQTTPTPF